MEKKNSPIPSPGTAAPRQLLGCLFLFLFPFLFPFLQGCASLPDWQHQDFLEQQVWVIYDLDAEGNGKGSHPIPIPSSREGLTILELRTDPATAGETFRQGQRWLVPPAGLKQLRLHCRYRVYRPHQDPSQPWPHAQQFFPGASRILHEPHGDG